MVKKSIKKKALNPILLSFGLLISINLFSQEISRNIFFAEASGVTGIYSVNYERLLRENRNINFGLRAGISLINNSIHYNSKVVFPVSVSLIRNIAKNHFMEIRAGISNNFYQYEDYSERGHGDTNLNYVPPIKTGYIFLPSIGIGYRYQPETKGLFINILAQRIVYFSEEHWFGNLSIGIGYAF